MNQTGRRKYTISPVPIEVLVPFMMTQFELCNLADGDKRISSISKGRRLLSKHEQEVVFGSREMANQSQLK